VRITDRKNPYMSHFLNPDASGLMTNGRVDTEQGVVGVEAYRQRSKLPSTVYLTIIVGGVKHQRQITGKVYTDRGLVTVARRFAREVGS
jgi:hypothetical protein